MIQPQQIAAKLQRLHPELGVRCYFSPDADTIRVQLDDPQSGQREDAEFPARLLEDPGDMKALQNVIFALLERFETLSSWMAL